MDTLEPEPQRNTGRVFLGMIIIVVGMAMLADRTGYEDIHLPAHMWPLILIALGLAKMMDPPVSRHGRPRSRRSGAWLLWIGTWGMVNEFHWFGFDYDTSWPLLIVGAGLLTVWGAIDSPGGQDRLRES